MMGAICCLEKAGLPLQQVSSQNDGRRGQTFSKVLKREEVRQIKILEVQEWSFYWWIFKCDLELNVSPYKNLHSTKLQKSKRRLLSQKLGCSETTKADLRNRRGLLSQKLGCSETMMADLRNRRGLLSQKLGCSETTRADLRNRRGTYFSSLVSTCHTHTQLCGNYGHSVEDFWRSRKHMNRTVQSPTSHTQQ
ncbi:hypothetical protein ACFX13_037868 [Malus domestica]